MNENIITWNLANWVSIVLMALLGFFVLGSIVSFIKKGQASEGTTAAQSADGY